MDEFTKIVSSAFEPFIGHHQEIFACVKSVLKSFLKSFFKLVFNWNHFEIRLLNLRIKFFIYCGVFFLVLVVFFFCWFFLCCFFFVFFFVCFFFLFFCVVSSFNTFRPKTWCDRQQLWKAVITGDTVTRLSIPIRDRGKITWRRPEAKFGRNVVKEETTHKKKKKKLPRWGKKVRNK